MSGKRINLKNAIWQIVASLIAHSVSILCGVNMAYSTVLLPHIMKSEEDFKNKTSWNTTNLNFTSWNATNNDEPQDLIIGKEEASWIASLMSIATPIGSLLAGPLMDRFGRQKMCAYLMIPIIVSWILVATTTTSVYTLYVARILAGLGGGLSTVTIVYVAEISHPSIRPMLLSLTSVFVSFGILLTPLLSYVMDWRTVAICCGGMGVVDLISVLFIPESPSWIVGMSTNDNDANKGLKKAERSLKWLYKKSEDYQHELESLVRLKEQKDSCKKDSALFKRKDIEEEVTFKSPQAWKPLAVLLVIFVLQQFSGAYLVVFYAIQIFEKSGSVEFDQLKCLIMLGAVRFLMAIISMSLSKKFGRRSLLITSALGMSAVILVAAGYIYFVGVGMLPIVCLLLFVLFASYGMTIIPWTLIGELLPLSVRGVGSGLSVAIAYIFMFLTVKLFLSAVDAIGIVAIFTSFSVFCLIFVVFVYFTLPETLGRTLQEIESAFK